MFKPTGPSHPLFFLLIPTLMILSAGNAPAGEGELEGKISVTIPAGSYQIREVSGTHEIDMEGYGRHLIPGKPDLPAKIFSLAVPPGAHVTEVSFDHGKGTQLPGTYLVPPASLPRVIGDENPAIFNQEKQKYESNRRAVYGSDDSYPEHVGEFVRTAGYRKYNLVDVRIAPLTYRPMSGKMTYHTEVTVHVAYTLPDNGSVQAMQDHLARTESSAREIIYNYDQAQKFYPKSTTSGGRGTYDFVIITLDSLKTAVQPLVDWETAKGRTVNVVTTDWIASNYAGYDLAEKQRNFLRDNYPSSEWGIEDVLLVGDYDDVPMRRCWQDTGYGKPETDYYYAELSKPDDQSWDMDQDHKWGENSDPIDFYAEINVGRIPWSSHATVQSICAKTVAAEKNQDPSYKKNILLLGAFFWPDTDTAVLMEYKSDGVMHAWMNGWKTTRMYESGHSKYAMDHNLKNANVESVWSGGTFAFVNWAGHGSPYSSHIYYSGVEAFVDTATCPKLNDQYPSIVFADACSNSDTDHDNIGQMMLEQGAVGFLGATKVAYGSGGWKTPANGSSQSLDYYFTTCCTSCDFTQGAGHQWSLRKMYTDGLFYYLKYEIFEWGALWGSPTYSLDCDVSLWASAGSISCAEGAAIGYSLEAGVQAANRMYLMLGSLSGSSPGFTLPGGQQMPLNWDGFTNTVLAMTGTPVFDGFMGNLDGSGRAAAQFDSLRPLDPVMIGLTATFAYLLSPPPAWDFTSNPIEITFDP